MLGLAAWGVAVSLPCTQVGLFGRLGCGCQAFLDPGLFGSLGRGREPSPNPGPFFLRFESEVFLNYKKDLLDTSRNRKQTHHCDTKFETSPFCH